MLTKAASFTVRRYDGETDYSAEVEKTFEKFKQAAVKDYRVKFSTSEEMNHIEARYWNSSPSCIPRYSRRWMIIAPRTAILSTEL